MPPPSLRANLSEAASGVQLRSLPARFFARAWAHVLDRSRASEHVGFDMTAFPFAASLAAARAPDAPRARTEDEATSLAGGPVFLAAEELPEAFATPEAA